MIDFHFYYFKVIQRGIELGNDRAFEEFETFMANTEAGLGDKEACELVRKWMEHWKDIQLHHKNPAQLSNQELDNLLKLDIPQIVSLTNWQLFQGMILRNVQCIQPVSDFSVFVETAAPEIQQNIFSLAPTTVRSFGEFVEKNEELLQSLTILGGSGKRSP